ncbi:MAG: thiamine pyrophosphate-dependent enzyme [Nocardioides sp.]|uniref:thiamine pyrophosphate-dependent enzyme n=1 Tax=Nocardioides sp. TaxID=35761 RepID=UPI0039E6C364
MRAPALDRDDVIAAVLASARRAGAAVFTSNGNNSRAAYHLGDHPSVFYAMGSMGQVSLLAAGFARRTGVPVVAIDGDGAVAMGAAGLPTAARIATNSFVHVAIDNSVYGTTGGQPVPVPPGWIEHLARGAGYARVLAVHDADELASAMQTGFASGGATFVHAVVSTAAANHYPRVAMDPADVTRRFRVHWGHDPAGSGVRL